MEKDSQPLPPVFITGREFEVLHLLSAGRSTPQIAGELLMNICTVEAFKRVLMKKFNAADVPQLLKHAGRYGLPAQFHSN
jgi:DNA-binding NarL/FixJ family response regulator